MEQNAPVFTEWHDIFGYKHRMGDWSPEQPLNLPEGWESLAHEDVRVAPQIVRATYLDSQGAAICTVYRLTAEATLPASPKVVRSQHPAQ